MTNYGTVTHNGKEYTLTQQAYIVGSNEDPYYIANATDSKGNEYEVEWELNEHTRKMYNEIERQIEAGGAPNYSLVEDESDACDWDNPIDVREIYCD